jgi:hypothetical protein
MAVERMIGLQMTDHVYVVYVILKYSKSNLSGDHPTLGGNCSPVFLVAPVMKVIPCQV